MNFSVDLPRYLSILMNKEYTNGEITVIWQPKKCQHAGICVKTLPQVYHPGEKPWIKVENASTDELKLQINRCPSGALSFKEVYTQGQ